MPPYASLSEFLADLMHGEAVNGPDAECWPNLIARISTPGQINIIPAETWDYFLDVLPPRWMGSGAFAFAEGAEPFRLFWKRQGRCFCRRLTFRETEQFCSLARIPLPH